MLRYVWRGCLWVIATMRRGQFADAASQTQGAEACSMALVQTEAETRVDHHNTSTLPHCNPWSYTEINTYNPSAPNYVHIPRPSDVYDQSDLGASAASSSEDERIESVEEALNRLGIPYREGDDYNLEMVTAMRSGPR